MKTTYTIVVLTGSAASQSANAQLVAILTPMFSESIKLVRYDSLRSLPHFDPDLSVGEVPDEIRHLRQLIDEADGMLICTPEYIFSIPSGLKNALEWCVATTVFTDKPTAFITASAHGAMGHSQLQLILETLSAKLNPQTTLLIQGIRGKIDREGHLTDTLAAQELEQFVAAFERILLTSNN